MKLNWSVCRCGFMPVAPTRSSAGPLPDRTVILCSRPPGPGVRLVLLVSPLDRAAGNHPCVEEAPALEAPPKRSQAARTLTLNRLGIYPPASTPSATFTLCPEGLSSSWAAVPLPCRLVPEWMAGRCPGELPEPTAGDSPCPWRPVPGASARPAPRRRAVPVAACLAARLRLWAMPAWGGSGSPPVILQPAERAEKCCPRTCDSFASKPA